MPRQSKAALARVILDGLAKLVRAIKGDPWAAAKSFAIIAVVAYCGPQIAPIFSTGIGQNTPFLVLAYVLVLFIAAFTMMLVGAWKSERH